MSDSRKGTKRAGDALDQILASVRCQAERQQIRDRLVVLIKAELAASVALDPKEHPAKRRKAEEEAVPQFKSAMTGSSISRLISRRVLREALGSEMSDPEKDKLIAAYEATDWKENGLAQIWNTGEMEAWEGLARAACDLDGLFPENVGTMIASAAYSASQGGELGPLSPTGKQTQSGPKGGAPKKALGVVAQQNGVFLVATYLWSYGKLKPSVPWSGLSRSDLVVRVRDHVADQYRQACPTFAPDMSPWSHERKKTWPALETVAKMEKAGADDAQDSFKADPLRVVPHQLQRFWKLIGVDPVSALSSNRS